MCVCGCAVVMSELEGLSKGSAEAGGGAAAGASRAGKRNLSKVTAGAK